jgi:Condensation domain
MSLSNQKLGTSRRQVFVRGPRPRKMPIIDYHRTRWASIQSGELGLEFVNSPHAAFKFLGPLNIDTLQSSIRALVARHAILSARVVDAPEGPEFHFNPEREIPLHVLDLSHADEAAARSTATEQIWKAFTADEPWFRIFVLKLSATEHVVGFVVHHFIADSWSVAIIIGELLHTYAAIEAGRQLSLPELPIQYSDYVTGVNAWIRGAGAAASAAYWREHLRNAPPTQLPPDFRVEPERTGPITTETQHLANSAVVKLRALSKSAGASMHALVAAAMAAVIAYESKANDVVVVSRVHGRNDTVVFGLIGAFFDSIALRVSVSLDMSFKSLATHMQRTLTRSSPHQDYPYHLVKPALPSIGASDVAPMLSFNDFQPTASEGSGGGQQGNVRPFSLMPRPSIEHSARRYTGIYTLVNVDQAGLRATTEYLSIMYRRETIVQFNQLFCHLLERAGSEPDRALSSLLAQ